MYRLFGYSTQNTMKPLYVLEELGVDYEYQKVNLMKGEQRSEEFLKKNPMGKTPVLQHKDFNLFESGAICRYLANVEESPLYPQDKMKRAQVDQWMDYFTCHLGRWLSTIFFEKKIKPVADEKKCEEALKFVLDQLAIVDRWLDKNHFFIGNEITIADLFAFAYIEQVYPLEINLSSFPHVNRWMSEIEKRESIRRGRTKAENI